MGSQNNIDQNSAAFTAGNPASGSGNRKPANVQQLVRENAQHLVQPLVFHSEALTVLLGSTLTALMENLTELYLPAIHTGVSNRPQKQTDKETLGFEDYLLELSERECASRRRSRIATAVQEPGLPREKTMASFDLKLLPVQARRQLKALRIGSFLFACRCLRLPGLPRRAKAEFKVEGLRLATSTLEFPDYQSHAYAHNSRSR